MSNSSQDLRPPERFERLYRDEYAAVVRYVRRRAPEELVDDVVCDTFVVAWRRLEDVPEQARPWLLAVARNVLGTHLRGRHRRAALRSRLSAQEIVTAGGADDVDRPALGSGVRDALAELAPRDREALILVAWEGLTAREAAEVLGESSGTFRVRVHRARARLRRLLEDAAGHAAEPSIPIGDAAHE
jgi:RNA polymerase sigma-70 factor (ECF subfamily)